MIEVIELKYILVQKPAWAVEHRVTYVSRQVGMYKRLS